MSVKYLNAVFEDSRATGSAFAVALALADWADHNGYCYPSRAQIARKARVSRATVPSAIQQLMDLGEVARQLRGHAPTTQDEDERAPVRLQRRNLYRMLFVKVKPQVGQPLAHHATGAPAPQVGQSPAHLSDPQVGQSDEGGRPIGGGEVGQSDRSHIRNKPSGDPSEDPSVVAAAVAAGRVDPTDPDEALVLAWNAAMAGTPIALVTAPLTPKRRRLIQARLADRPLDQHAEAFRRIAASAYCRHEKPGKDFQASFLWYIGGPDPALNALEGLYDERAPRSAASRERSTGPRTTWDAVLERLATTVSTAVWHTWFRPTRWVAEDATTLTVGIPSPHFAVWLPKHYAAPIAAALAATGKAGLRVVFVEAPPVARERAS